MSDQVGDGKHHDNHADIDADPKVVQRLQLSRHGMRGRGRRAYFGHHIQRIATRKLAFDAADTHCENPEPSEREEIRGGTPIKLHCVIISWNAHHDKSFAIASRIAPHVDALTVIYSNADEADEDGPGNWIHVPNSWFYGSKFKVALDVLRDDEVMLLIQADAECIDWPGLANRCREIMEPNPHVGVWVPRITETAWSDQRVTVATAAEQAIRFVTQSDGIVFALPVPVLQRLRNLSYEHNNLGWGIDWIAICYAYTHDMLVVSDHAITVEHIMDRRYSWDEAYRQMELFLRQMTVQESLMYVLLNSFCDPQVADLRSNQFA